MSPLEFMQRLAVLVPRPRLHLIRFHGVLAPNAKLRPEIIPSSGRQAGNPSGPALLRSAAVRRPVPGSPGGVNATDTSDDHGDTPHPSAPTRISWARLLKRVFEIDIEQCPQCGGALKIIAAIEHPPVIVKILAHLGFPARAPPRSPARSFDLFQMA